MRLNDSIVVMQLLITLTKIINVRSQIDGNIRHTFFIFVAFVFAAESDTVPTFEWSFCGFEHCITGRWVISWTPTVPNCETDINDIGVFSWHEQFNC